MVTASAKSGGEVESFPRRHAKHEIEVGELKGAARQAGFRLRHEVLCRRLGELPLREDGLETDAWDEDALHIHVSAGARLLAYVRVLFPGARPLLMETLNYPMHQLPDALQGRVAEISRMIVLPDAPMSLRKEVDLLGLIMENARALTLARGDFRAWVFDIESSVERGLLKRDWPLVPFSAPLLHHRVERRAFYVSLADMRPHHFRRPNLHRTQEPRV